MSLTKSISQFIDNTLIDLGRQFRWSYLPPLMIYVATGIITVVAEATYPRPKPGTGWISLKTTREEIFKTKEN